MKKQKLSVIIPCYNEEKSIEPLYKAFKNCFQSFPFKVELIFVDDGSSDKTFIEIKKCLKKQDFEIEAVHFSRNFGKEAAMYAGLERATGDYIGIIDADLQQKPELLVEMVKVLEEKEEYDCVCCYQERRIEDKTIAFMKKKFYALINKISEVELVDGASDFRVFRRYVVESILSLKEANRFSKGIFSWVGFNTYYMPYTPESRLYGKSSFGLKKLFLYAISGIISFSVAPLRIATFGGLFVSMLCFLYLLVVIIQKIFFTIDVPGYPTLIVTVLLIGSLILFCLGIIGEYIARIYMETKKRPLYITKEELTNKKN